MPPNKFVYDAKTSTFRLVSDGTVKDGTAVKDGARSREKDRALSLRTAKAPVARELCKPDQFMYASRTSAFYLFGEEPGHARDSEDSESEERSAVMHRQAERRRQEASKTGESIGEALLTQPFALAIIGKEARAQTEPTVSTVSGSAGELHTFVSKTWQPQHDDKLHTKMQHEPTHTGTRKPITQSVIVTNKMSGTSASASTSDASTHKAGLAQHRARAEIAEQSAAVARQSVQMLEQDMCAAQKAQVRVSVRARCEPLRSGFPRTFLWGLRENFVGWFLKKRNFHWAPLN